MSAEIGVMCLALAWLAACFGSAYLLPLPQLRARLSACLPAAMWIQTLWVSCALVMLISLRLENDFSVENVFLHSSLALPTLYKITGAWGNHEGSMLLWALVVCAFGLAMIHAPMESPVRRVALAIQSALSTGVLAFILLTSNPFARVFPPPADGQTLNPILQDMALAIHPPLLYIGYVGFSSVFSLAIAALLVGRIDRAFAALITPWASFAWAFLTLGIGLGSWWAYRELGWGGFWFWDPVENASLLPWLAGTALLHSVIVLKKRGSLASWVVLLAILTFALSLLGTFLVRSGVLTSVHSFATDPARGLFILLYMAVFVGGGLLIYSLRAGTIDRAQDQAAPLSRDGAMIFNNLFLISACAIVFFGTVYPLIADALAGIKLTVGPPYFNIAFIPVMCFAVALAGLSPWLAWKKADIGQALHEARPALLAAATAGVITLAAARPLAAYGIIGIALGVWLLISTMLWLHRRGHGLPRLSALALALGHFGAAFIALGVTGAGLWQEESERLVSPGETLSIADYQVEYHQMEPYRGPGYEATRAEFIVRRDNDEITRLYPEYRRYDIRGTVTHEAAIYSTALSDLHVVIGDVAAGSRLAVRAYHVPLAGFLWIGCGLMAAGGLCGFYNRRKNSV